MIEQTPWGSGAHARVGIVAVVLVLVAWLGCGASHDGDGVAGPDGGTGGAGANTAATGGRGQAETGGATGGATGGRGSGATGGVAAGGAGGRGSEVTGGAEAAGAGGAHAGGATAGGAGMAGRGAGGLAAGGGGGVAGALAAGGAGRGGTAGSAGAATCGPEPDAATRAQCTGTNPIACHFGGEPGDYEVTVVLGGAKAGNTYVEAESGRRMLGTVATAAGETKRFSFVVNVRQPEGQPLQDVPAGTPGLDLYFRGTAPLLDGLAYRKRTSGLDVYIAGDSTVCDQDGTDYAGWGQFLPQHFGCGVSLANYADSGESSVSFLHSSALWGAVKSRVGAKDWVLIQLGHNDKTTSAATLESDFTTMVNDAKAKGAFPVLITPIARIGYTLAEEHVWTVDGATVNIPQIIRALGTKLGVPVIDLTVTTWNWEQTLGSGWPDFFALGTDHTHTNQKGADVIAGFVRDALLAQKLGLASYLR